MLFGEILALCLIFLILPPVAWRITYLIQKNQHEKFMEQVNALNQLKSALHNTLNGINSTASTTSPEFIKKLKMRKSMILEKLDSLVQLISNKTEIPVVFENIMDTYTQTEVLIKTLPKEKLRHSEEIIIGSDYTYMKQLTYKLITENIFPEKTDFDEINLIYKKFKRMKKIKK